MKNDQFIEDMRFSLTYLEEQVAQDPSNEPAARALRGAKLMELALDGISGMLRALPLKPNNKSPSTSVRW